MAVKDLGLRCVTIATHYRNKSLDSKKFRPFFEKVSSLGIPIWILPKSKFLINLDFPKTFG